VPRRAERDLPASGSEEEAEGVGAPPGRPAGTAGRARVVASEGVASSDEECTPRPLRARRDEPDDSTDRLPPIRQRPVAVVSPPVAERST
jgi:hypothetical protein